MKTLIMNVGQFAGAAFLSLGLLSACATQNNGETSASDELAIQEAEAQAPASPALPSLMFQWPLGEGTLIAPPIDIQRAAIEACRLRGYDTSYMINVGIDGNMGIGEFGCRGAD